MLGQGIIRIFVIFAMGAILYNVLTHPKGTQALASGVTGILETGLSYSARGRGPTGRRR